MEKNNNRRNRSVLKSYFQKGAIPTEQQFAELIDSVSNIVEDGQVMRTPQWMGVFPWTSWSLGYRALHGRTSHRSGYTRMDSRCHTRKETDCKECEGRSGDGSVARQIDSIVW